MFIVDYFNGCCKIFFCLVLTGNKWYSSRELSMVKEGKATYYGE